ncbi:Cobyrinic acid a,c-diamide synthase [Methanoregula boonei 6A8]|jgi:CO dehydrogenase maturation factor|uniref:Cobyrinic acid a,c-diamide synthase n=1 Tax=Methanoregula boonei (strain DSM 21154 / JCM 14090 / 6A8) TaxID=456442 RepID=A7I6P2_METB6|nr:AAA family ATPase [Methanoregula boonei]ABS55403.1 Cobyrinic acid a,c-diamide synthase [Methanoregula boonei 6A8]
MPEDARHKERGIRVVITGKGGVGKTTLAALLSHLFAQDGKRVLAIDSDPQQNLAATLGIPKARAEGIIPVSESPSYLREKMGAGPDLSLGGLFSLNPDISDVIDRFSVPAGENVRLLVMGGVKEAGGGCLCPEYTLLAAILRQMQVFDDDVVILDTSAGLEHFGRAIAEGFTSAVVVTDPTYNAVSVARKSAVLAHQLGIENVILVINRSEDNTTIRNVCGGEGGFAEFTQTVVLPFDPVVRRTEPSVISLAGSDSAFVSNVRILLAAIAGRCEKWSPPAR